MVRVRLPPAVSLNPGCMPLFVALIATAFFGERLSAARKLGLGLILGGSVMLVGWHAAGWSAARSLSDALFVGASLLTAGFTVPMPRAKLDPLHAAALVSTGSLALYGPLYLAFCGARLARLPAAPRLARRSAPWCRCCRRCSRSRCSASGRAAPIGPGLSSSPLACSWPLAERRGCEGGHDSQGASRLPD